MILYKIENARTKNVIAEGLTEEQALEMLRVSRRTLMDKLINNELVRQWFRVTPVDIDGKGNDKEKTEKVFKGKDWEDFKAEWRKMQKLYGIQQEET